MGAQAKPAVPRDASAAEATARFWSARLGRPVSHEEARQMVANVTGFFDVLARWDTATPTPNSSHESFLRGVNEKSKQPGRL
jgi:hypothetical protein